MYTNEKYTYDYKNNFGTLRISIKMSVTEVKRKFLTLIFCGYLSSVQLIIFTKDF
jgi:hypothetical protein